MHATNFETCHNLYQKYKLTLNNYIHRLLAYMFKWMVSSMITPWTHHWHFAARVNGVSCAYAGTSHTAELAWCQLCNQWSPPGTGICRHDKHRCHPWRQSWHHALVIRDVSYANPEVCWLKNTPRQNDRHFSNDSFNCSFLYKHFRSLIQIAQKDISRCFN